MGLVVEETMRLKNRVRRPANPTRAASLLAKIVLRCGAGRGLYVRASVHNVGASFEPWSVPLRELICGLSFAFYSSFEPWCVRVRALVCGVRFAFCSMSARAERIACCPSSVWWPVTRGVSPRRFVSDATLLHILYMY